MNAKLYIVHGSHPCAAVVKAAELKGLELETVELPPPAHALIIRALRFPARTVPALKIDGERLSGSRTIMERLDRLAADPPLYPADPEARARVVEAERFDDDVLQVHVRRILWTAFKRNRRAMPSFLEGGRLPLPGPVVVLNAPLITRIALGMNPGSPEARSELADLPATLDRVDGWIAAGVLGGERPNAAELKLAASLRLLSTIADVAPILAARPAFELAQRIYPGWNGAIPAGTLPAEWLPAGVTAAA